jgi:excinuclease ABC subunit A
VLRLVDALDAVVDAGHSVLCVEHDPVLLSNCDWLIELGPGGGPDGGRLIAEGPPQAVATGDSPIASWLS